MNKKENNTFTNSSFFNNPASKLTRAQNDYFTKLEVNTLKHSNLPAGFKED